MRYIQFILLSILYGTSLCSANNGAIAGCLLNSAGGPVPNAEIHIENTNNGTISGEDGCFIISSLTPGNYDLIVRHIAFSDVFIPGIVVTAGDTVYLDNIPMETRIDKLKPVIVTASRRLETEFKSSVPFNYISEDKILTRNAKTSAEALREERGVFIQKTNHGGGSAIIRGMSSNQILLLVDGIRLNNSTYRLGNHQYLTTVDQNILSQIEILHGPASVLYGSDALGGVINLRTSSPDYPDSNSSFNYKLISRFASADLEKMVHGSLSYTHRFFHLSAGYSHKIFGDLKRGAWNPFDHRKNPGNRATQNPSGYEGYDWDIQMNIRPSYNQSFVLKHQISEQTEVPRYDKYEDSGYYKWLYSPQSRNLSYMSYNISNPIKHISKFNTTLSYHVQKEGRITQKSMDNPITEELDKVRTYGVSLNLSAPLRRHILISGMDLYFDHISSNRYFIDPFTTERQKAADARYPDGALYNSYGFFIRDEYSMTRKFSIAGGLRYTFIESAYRLQGIPAGSFLPADMESLFESVTGSMNLQYKLNPDIFLNLNFSQGFRAPNISDFSKFGESKGSIFEIPNPDLQPEKLQGIDFTMKVENKKYQACFSSYIHFISDVIASADDQYQGASFILWNGTYFKIKSKQNTGRGYITGIETSGTFKFNRNTDLYANLTYTYGENTTLQEPIGGIPPLFGLIGLDYNHRFLKIGLFSRFAAKQSRLSSDDKDDLRIQDGGTPKWFTLNIRSGIELMPDTILRVAIENILNMNYREHGSGINAPGRNFIVSINIKN
ncbi:MAG: TonB-dependent receptor [Calditrichaceae bacterium]|nr:TonB-dependent receptor [Calditrichaceae bacterium]MBN2710069.1 TonB-dependent receptor [Calditrichaceae bacterium]RQV94515.1 MAG: TonB-dependent receptor [Calditrichota bacterium]